MLLARQGKTLQFNYGKTWCLPQFELLILWILFRGQYSSVKYSLPAKKNNQMISIEIILILIWLLLLGISIFKKTERNTSLLVSCFIIGTLFIWLDNTQGQITYTTNINFPIIHYPIAIISLAALYFFSIVRLAEFIYSRLSNKPRNKYISAAVVVLIIAILNFLSPLVDFIIVNTKAGIFTNDHINQFYTCFAYNSSIRQYQVFAYLFFLLAIYLSILLGFIFRKAIEMIIRKKMM